MKLLFGWKFRLKLRAEGEKLCAEGDKLWVEGDKLRTEGDNLRTGRYTLRAGSDKLCAEGEKLCAEGEKLRAEGNKLYAESKRLWAELILDTYGNIKLEWKNWSNEYGSYECHLENGEVYGFDNLDNDMEVKCLTKSNTK